jgi:hypothetical protein
MRELIFMLIVAGLFTAMPALAAENVKSDINKECVIRCVVEAESLVEKIRRLKTEIESGKSTYSDAELKKLELQLKEASETMKSLEKR